MKLNTPQKYKFSEDTNNLLRLSTSRSSTHTTPTNQTYTLESDDQILKIKPYMYKLT